MKDKESYTPKEVATLIHNYNILRGQREYCVTIKKQLIDRNWDNEGDRKTSEDDLTEIVARAKKWYQEEIPFNVRENLPVGDNLFH